MIISKTPLRISFLGGNTDFPDFFKLYGGCVLTTTINKYLYCIIRRREENKIFVNWLEKEVVNNIDEVKHDLVREALKKTRIDRGIEITFMSDIHSEGSGLGSSASVLVGLLNGLYSLKGYKPAADRLAREAVEIEIDALKRPVGIQDPYAVAYGGFRFFQFDKSGKVTNRLVYLDRKKQTDLNRHLMIFFTGQVRKSFSVLTDVKKGLNNNRDSLMKLKELAKLGCSVVEAGDFLRMGELLHKGWLIKKSMSSFITNNVIDNMYEKALESGAVGGKILGAGGGGFLMLVVPETKKITVRKALSGFSEMPIKIEEFGSKVIFNSKD